MKCCHQRSTVDGSVSAAGNFAYWPFAEVATRVRTSAFGAKHILVILRHSIY
jgi:hypothetical protein